MTTQNWPDPKRKGFPLFPERDGKHVLVERKTGNHIDADWYEADAEYFIPNGSMKTKHAGECYVYSHCESVSLTPTQINEMLAAERERCASVVISHAISPSPIDDTHPDAEWLNGHLSSCVDAIRNLGAAP